MLKKKKNTKHGVTTTALVTRLQASVKPNSKKTMYPCQNDPSGVLYYFKHLPTLGKKQRFASLSCEERFFYVVTKVCGADDAIKMLKEETLKKSGLVNAVWKRGQPGAQSILSRLVEECALPPGGEESDNCWVSRSVVKYMLDELDDVDVNEFSPLAKACLLGDNGLVFALASHKNINADIRFGIHLGNTETALDYMLRRYGNLIRNSFFRKDIAFAFLALCRASSDSTLRNALSKSLKMGGFGVAGTSVRVGADATFALIDLPAVVAWHVDGVRKRREARVFAIKVVKRGVWGWLERAQAELGSYSHDGAARVRDMVEYEEAFGRS